MKKATQPVEAPSALTANQPVEAPGASSEMLFTGQDSSLPLVVDSLHAQPAATIKKSAMSLSGSGVLAEEPAADTQFSYRVGIYRSRSRSTVRCVPGTLS